MDDLFFEDPQVGDTLTSAPYETTREEMVAFAQKWDPLPIHVDEDAARRSPHGGLIGSGEYSMAVKQLLITRMGMSNGIIASIGYDDLRFVKPVRPSDGLTLTVACVDKRASRSKPDRGVVKFRVSLENQRGETVLSYLDMVMMAKRGAEEAPRIT